MVPCFFISLIQIFQQIMTNLGKIKLQKWIILTISWMVLGALITIYFDLYIDSSYFTPAFQYSFQYSLLASILGGFLGGVIGGSLMIFYFDEKFKNKPFVFKILINVGFVMAIILIVNIIISILYIYLDVDPRQNGKPFSQILNRFISRDHLISQVTWLTIVSTTTFTMNLIDSFGPRKFLGFVIGKYHRPFTEQRIFMFLDIKSSTTIAEAIGHQKYFQFLQEFYSDITNPIIESQGEIYQYVGDEVVLTWEMHHGIKNGNCLNCFFRVEKEISGLNEKYLKKYGVVPEFKAGVHFGKVTTGEVGIIKKDIIHTGDVLNTTARIENKCNWLNAKLLASKNLVDLINVKDQFTFTSKGKIELRGKSQMVELMEVSTNLKIKG